ncbi:MAG TPA: class I SAM-dependent methyltransferase [Cellvibrio sp.]|nr:class I SAM-dependent methyltransferase [Cellvibrio sp.]
MEIIDEYIRQQQWRNWSGYLQHIPLMEHQQVLDLGCSVGEVSRLLAGRCAQVTGIDINPQFINYCIENARINQTFICSDLLKVDYSSLGPIDGIWASYALSYLSDPALFLRELYQHMSNESWIALVDVSCFISGNLPSSSSFYSTVHDFEIHSVTSGVYDFDFGSRMEKLVEAAGFTIIHQDNNVYDQELNFNGPVDPEVLENWQARLARMQGLKKRLTSAYDAMCCELLENLQRQSHSMNENVKFLVAIKRT